MSYIDTFDHEFVGYFGHLPIYHPLVEHQPSRGDFSCNPSNLIIGGGSGEYAALILKHPERAVTSFVTDWQIRIEDEARKQSDAVIASMARWSREWIDDVEAEDYRDALEFAGWGVEEFHNFLEMCTSPVVRTPFAKRGVFENWLLACFGEFIIFSMPELVPELDERLPGAREVLHPLYTNILLPPPGYPVHAGRRVIDGKLVYNQRWWRNIP